MTIRIHRKSVDEELAIKPPTNYDEEAMILEFTAGELPWLEIDNGDETTKRSWISAEDVTIIEWRP